MVLENICPPALLYLAFSIIQIIIDMYKGDTIQAFFKFIVMIIFTIVLNAICSSGMTIISWFIVFIPFILMTYVTTILFFIFGVNPSKIKPSINKKCSETQFGCCPDGVTIKSDSLGRSCSRMSLANVLKVPEPIPANSKDDRYLYPRGRSSHDYWINGGGERYRDNWKDKRKNDWWRNKKITNWDNEYYNSKRSGKDKDRLRSKYSPKGIDKSLSGSYRKWNDNKGYTYKRQYDDSSIDPLIMARLLAAKSGLGTGGTRTGTTGGTTGGTRTGEVTVTPEQEAAVLRKLMAGCAMQ